MRRCDTPRILRILSPLIGAACLTLSATTGFAQSPGGGAPPAPQGQPAPPAQEQPAARNPALEPFRQVLERYGTVAPHPRYGEVWLPGAVPEGWNPYPPCHWVFDRQQNAWVYQDPTEWGSIVHRYGRWALDQQSGWMWIADANAGPGWVYWKSEPGRVSWAALGPEMDGQAVPTDGWHMQDQRTFTAGCRASAPPPPPVAASGPRPAAMPMPIPMPLPAPAPPPVYVAPAYPVPVGPPPVAIVPVPIPGPRPPPIVVIAPPIFVPGDHCRRFPASPACRPRPNGPGPGPGTGPGKGAGPGPVPDPGTGPGKGTGPGTGPVAGPVPPPTTGTKPGLPPTPQQKKACELNPASAGCRGQTAARPTGPVQPARVAAVPRAKPIVSPYPRPGTARPTYAMRPNPAFRPVRVSGGSRPAYSPAAARPRPVAMTRPAARPQGGGGGGGHRGGGKHRH